MLHKAWNSKGEMPYCFRRSSIKFQGHMGQNITDFDCIFFWVAIDHDLQGQFDLKIWFFWFHHCSKYITTIQPPESHEYLDCFTGLFLSWSPSSVHTYTPRLFHGPDCFTVSTRCMYTDLGRWGYCSVHCRSCICLVWSCNWSNFDVSQYPIRTGMWLIKSKSNHFPTPMNWKKKMPGQNFTHFDWPMDQ